MKTTTDRQHAYLIKRYHTLATRLGMTAYEKKAIMESYGVDSSLELSNTELTDLCNKLDADLNPIIPKLDKLRKQVMASIGGWLKATGQESTAQRIKAIACRATEYDRFNDIPSERLRNICYAFNNKQKDLKAVGKLASDEMDILTYLN